MDVLKHGREISLCGMKFLCFYDVAALHSGCGAVGHEKRCSDVLLVRAQSGCCATLRISLRLELVSDQLALCRTLKGPHTCAFIPLGKSIVWNFNPCNFFHPLYQARCINGSFLSSRTPGCRGPPPGRQEEFIVLSVKPQMLKLSPISRPYSMHFSLMALDHPFMVGTQKSMLFVTR